MFCYPGGTGLDRTARRYQLTQNFLSDLGMTVAYNGQANRIGASLFVVSLVVLVIGFGMTMWWFIRLYSNTPTTRNLAWGAGVVGLAVCLSFVGVALTPENAAMGLHGQFTLFAFRAFPVACVLLFFAAWKSGVATARVTLVWLFAALLLSAYVVFLGIGPSARTPEGLVAAVIAQKLVSVVIVVALTYICRATAQSLIPTVRPYPSPKP